MPSGSGRCVGTGNASRAYSKPSLMQSIGLHLLRHIRQELLHSSPVGSRGRAGKRLLISKFKVFNVHLAIVIGIIVRVMAGRGH